MNLQSRDEEPSPTKPTSQAGSVVLEKEEEEVLRFVSV